MNKQATMADLLEAKAAIYRTLATTNAHGSDYVCMRRWADDLEQAAKSLRSAPAPDAKAATGPVPPERVLELLDKWEQADRGEPNEEESAAMKAKPYRQIALGFVGGFRAAERELRGKAPAPDAEDSEALHMALEKVCAERDALRAERDAAVKKHAERCEQVDTLQQRIDEVCVALGWHCEPSNMVDRIRILRGQAGAMARERYEALKERDDAEAKLRAVVAEIDYSLSLSRALTTMEAVSALQCLRRHLQSILDRHAPAAKEGS